MSISDFREVAELAQLVDENDSDGQALAKLKEMYEKIRAVDHDENTSSTTGMTSEQAAIEDANYLLDNIALSDNGKWSEVRPKLGEIYRSVGRNDMADFVDPK